MDTETLPIAEELPLDLQTVIGSDNAIQQIQSRVEAWQNELSAFFPIFEEAANCFRLLESSSGTRVNKFTRTRVGETIRATEALTTSIYRMMTAQDPCYDLINMNGNQTSQQLYSSHLMMRYQDNMLRWRRNLLRSIRSGTLFGTTIIEKPWMEKRQNGNLLWEGLGFVPRSLLQCAFEPNIFAIENTPWIAFLDYLSEDQLLDLADTDPDHWNPLQIQKAIELMKQQNSQASAKIDERRRRAGYRDLPLYEVCTYYGRLRDLPREDKRAWCVRVINMQVPIAAYGNPSPTGELPFEVAKYVDFEMEPFGYGVFQLGKLPQRHLDDNRERYMDTIKMAQYNMWLLQTTSGIKKSDLKIKPNGIVDALDVNGLKPLMPDLNSVNLSLQLEALLRQEHQGNTGAVPGLQAQVSDASATEASIAQNEAIRRVSVIAEDMAEPLVRRYQQSKHEYNAAWVEMDMWMAVAGMEKPVRVNRFNMAPEANVFVKITTDKDFRPKRMEHLMQAYQILTSIRNRPDIRVEDTQLLTEIFRGLDINPKTVIRDVNNLAPTSVLNYLVAAKQNASNAAQELGPEANAKLNEAGVPGASTVDTPVGATMVTP